MVTSELMERLPKSVFCWKQRSLARPVPVATRGTNSAQEKGNLVCQTKTFLDHDHNSTGWERKL